MVRFYNQIGFNSVWGAVGEDAYRAAKELGMAVFKSAPFCPNV